MYNIVIIVKESINLNHTLASIKFGYYGQNNKVEYIICKNWKSGFNEAISKGYEYGLFVKSGTVFYDIQKFIQKINRYPQNGLIAHLTNPLDNEKYPWIHDQCFFLSLHMFEGNDFEINDDKKVIPIYSDKNIHHNYTPLWIKSSSTKKRYTSVNFGESLINKILTLNRQAINWNNSIRGEKEYLYNNLALNKWYNYNNDYRELAESQIWVFNNEEISVESYTNLICPASGLFWMFNILFLNGSIFLVDISKKQLDFVEKLWNDWDGYNYGEFVYNYIKRNNIIHIMLDNKIMDEYEKIKLADKAYFITQVNDTFNTLLNKYNIDNFPLKWQIAKNKKITFVNDNIIDWVLSNKDKLDGYYIWISNILNYKYSLLMNTNDEFNQFNKIVNNNMKRILAYE